MNRSPALPSSSSVNGRRWTAMILSLLMLAGCSRPEPVPNPEISPSPTPSYSTVSEKLNDQRKDGRAGESGAAGDRFF